jgi:hypothetical protein
MVMQLVSGCLFFKLISLNTFIEFLEKKKLKVFFLLIYTQAK